MRFDRIDRIHPKLGEETKELFEIKLSLAHGQMFVSLGMVIVEMNLPQIASEGSNPFRKGGLPHAEGVVVTGVKTESEMGRMDPV